MKTFLLATVLALGPVAAFAQQPGPPPSPQEQALSGKLMAEINENIQLRSALISANDRSIALQKQVDDLKAKYEPPVKK